MKMYVYCIIYDVFVTYYYYVCYMYFIDLSNIHTMSITVTFFCLLHEISVSTNIVYLHHFVFKVTFTVKQRERFMKNMELMLLHCPLDFQLMLPCLLELRVKPPHPCMRNLWL